jgi:hypothetical protein
MCGRVNDCLKAAKPISTELTAPDRRQRGGGHERHAADPSDHAKDM